MLDGKTILITQAGHFVGPGTASLLSDLGARVICQDPDFASEDARANYQESHPDCELISSDDPADMAQACRDLAGGLDALICNDAFPAIRAAVEDADICDMQDGLDALVTRPFALIGQMVPMMKAQGHGNIVMVTSAAPLRGLANYSMYATARGAGNALTKSLSLELAPHNIQINAVAPNYIENPTYFPPELLANEAAMAKMLKNIPMKRLGQPSEVAALIAFLVSGQCTFMTGHVLPIAGGWA